LHLQGKRIFSTHCTCVSPQAEGDVAAFCAFTMALLRQHLEAAAATPAAPRSADAVAATAAAHARFCTCQLENDKTRRILAKALGAEFADAYMEGVLFDAHLPGVACAPSASAGSAANDAR
jgi:phycocyanobilin:ferredoxin oxidoreductase